MKQFYRSLNPMKASLITSCLLISCIASAFRIVPVSCTTTITSSSGYIGCTTQSMGTHTIQSDANSTGGVDIGGWSTAVPLVLSRSGGANLSYTFTFIWYPDSPTDTPRGGAQFLTRGTYHASAIINSNSPGTGTASAFISDTLGFPGTGANCSGAGLQSGTSSSTSLSPSWVNGGTVTTTGFSSVVGPASDGSYTCTVVLTDYISTTLYGNIGSIVPGSSGKGNIQTLSALTGQITLNLVDGQLVDNTWQ